MFSPNIRRPGPAAAQEVDEGLAGSWSRSRPGRPDFHVLSGDAGGLIPLHVVCAYLKVYFEEKRQNFYKSVTEKFVNKEFVSAPTYTGANASGFD